MMDRPFNPATIYETYYSIPEVGWTPRGGSTSYFLSVCILPRPELETGDISFGGRPAIVGKDRTFGMTHVTGEHIIAGDKETPYRVTLSAYATKTLADSGTLEVFEDFISDEGLMWRYEERLHPRGRDTVKKGLFTIEPRIGNISCRTDKDQAVVFYNVHSRAIALAGLRAMVLRAHKLKNNP